MTPWRASLRTAQWRDLPFKVLGNDAIVGRRVHVHEYPNRDDPWPEDLGRRTRAFSVRGYLVGDDVGEQIRAFEEAAEKGGSGELVHPFRGTKIVTLLSCASTDTFEEGRVVRMVLEFVESGDRRYPSFLTNGPDEVGGAAALLDKAAGVAGIKAIGTTVQQGFGGVQSLVTTARSYVATAQSLVSGATGAIRSVSAIAGVAGIGNLGRFLGTGSGGILGQVTSLTSGVTSALGRFNAARTAVTSLGGKVMSLVSGL